MQQKPVVKDEKSVNEDLVIDEMDISKADND